MTRSVSRRSRGGHFGRSDQAEKFDVGHGGLSNSVSCSHMSICIALAWILLLSVTMLSSSASAHTRAPYWPYDKALSRIDGARIRVGHAIERIDASLVTCTGEGPSRRRSGVRRWRHFDCLEAQFAPKRDLSFRVHALGKRAFVITNARYGY